MPLTFQHCLPHTSFLSFIAAYSSNIFPCAFEILVLFYSYRDKTYIDHQTVIPSFWFRWWRPCFLLAGMLYDVGMLVYSIYKEDIVSILLAVRIAIVVYQLSDQYWMIKHWIPFFVRKEKQRFLIVRFALTAYAWFLVVGSTSWTGSWNDKQDIYSSVYFLSIFVIGNICGVWYLMQGGVDFLIQYRFHCTRNVFGWLALSGMIMGIVGLSIGDGGGNNLVNTLYYHSAFVMIYSYVEFTIVVMVHRFIVVYEEESWKYQNVMSLNHPMSSPSMLVSHQSTTFDATNGCASTSNKVACDVDISSSSPLVELATTGSIPTETVIAAVPPPAHHIQSNNNDDDGQIPMQGERMVGQEEDGKEEEKGDLEAARSVIVGNNETCAVNMHALSIPRQETIVAAPSERHTNRIAVDGMKASNEGKTMVEEDGKVCVVLSESATIKPFADVPPSMASPSITAPLIRTGSMIVLYQSQRRRFALAFDGITRRGSILRSNILTHEIMMVKLKRHELVCREFDKLYCVIYQLLIWEILLWLAQIFLGLYLRSVNTPLPSGQNSYYCQTPLENTINSAQFINDFVFARR